MAFNVGLRLLIRSGHGSSLDFAEERDKYVNGLQRAAAAEERQLPM